MYTRKNLKKLIEIIGDISGSLDGKRVKQVLHHNNETLQSILNSLAEGVIVANKDGKFQFFNPVAEKILGIGLKNVTSVEWSSVYGCYYPDKATPYPSEKLPLAKALKGQEIMNELIFIKNPERPDGVYINVSARPIKGINGSINGGTVVFQDITESKQNEKELRKLSNAVEQTADSVFITDKKGIIEYVNPAFEATTGYSREEVLGQTPKILQSGMHDKSFYQNLWKTILKGKTYRGTIINKKKSGKFYWSEQTITPMKGDTGKITNFVSVLKDITELKEKQEQEFYLSIARELQQRYYKVKVTVPGFDIAGATYSAVETSGDYFDFISMADGSIGIVIGDVCGHGIGSALIMAQTRAYLRAFAKVESDPGVLLTRLNQELVADLDNTHYVTLTLARLDPNLKVLDYANAGHLPAYLLNSNGETKCVMESTGIPLGIMHNYKYEKSKAIKLTSDDVVVFLTDGITEAHAINKSEFGLDRALNIIRSHQNETARQIIVQLYQAVCSFTKRQTQEDDITSIICKVNSINDAF